MFRFVLSYTTAKLRAFNKHEIPICCDLEASENDLRLLSRNVIFAIHMSLKRNIFANILLSVVLPIVFLAPFHHHDHPLSQEISCVDCTHHQPHPGHISLQTITDECLICHFLAQVYVPAFEPAASLLSSDCVTVVSHISGDLILRHTLQSSPRSPPATFCF